jgi:carbamoylphosphate synthase large subunit
LIRAKICGTWCLEEQWKKVEWKIAQKLDVNCPNNLAQKAFRSKFRMRQEWNQISGQSTKSTLIKASTLAAAPLDFPFIAKPNNAFASAGVFLVKNESDWKQAANLISKINSILLPSLEQEEAGILCEEYIDGTEISVDAISCDGKTFPLGICQRSFISESNFQDYVYLLNPRKNEIPEITQLENLLSIFFKKIGHSFGPTHSEFRFRKSDRQWVLIETANRIGAGGYIGSLIENCLSIPYQKLALMASLRRLNPSELENLNIQDVKYGIFFVPNAGSGGKLKAIHGLLNFQQDPRIIQLKLTKKVGDHLRPYPKGPDYPALILASSSDRNELMALIKDIERELHFEYT